MDVNDLLLELYGRVGPLVAEAVDGLSPDQLQRSPVAGANTIGWLAWHLTRVQDHHVAELLETEQLWVSDGWAGRFGLDADPSNIGYGHDAEAMAAIRPEGPQLLVDHYEAVQARTDAMLATLSAPDLDRIVDRRWDPPVSLGVRLVSIADDSLQHAGQANYLRGMFGW